MIDTHCHFGDRAFADDRMYVLERARIAGISHFIAIGDSLQESEWNVAFAKNQKGVFCTVGIHPHNSKEWKNEHRKQLEVLAEDAKVVGIGEIGLDYHYSFSPRDVQERVFALELTLAKELNLPAIIHSREAIDDTWRIIQSVQPKKLVLHCCSERWEDVRRFVDAGYFLSFTGIVTYSKSDIVRETVRQCPIDRIMIETDSPYLAPVPHRGKRNEPAFVVEVAKKIADIKGLSVEEVDRVTTENAKRFFDM